MAKLHYYYSTMNAGKSTILLQSSHNYNERGMNTLLLTPEIDSRYEVGQITSRIGLSNKAFAFNHQHNLYDYVTEQISQNNNIKCVLVDEAQFLAKHQVHELCHIADHIDIPVLTFGLRSDFKGEPFEGSLYLLVLADIIIELKTICHCGKKATMNMRIDESGKKVHDGAQIEIGGNDRYIAVCRKHYHEGIGKP